MPDANVTKTDVQFDAFHVYRQSKVEGQPPQVVTHWYVSVSYRVLTVEGEEWERFITEEITGGFKTKAASLLDAIRTYVLQKEGLA